MKTRFGKVEKAATVINGEGDEMRVSLFLSHDSAHYRPLSVFNSAAIRKALSNGLPESIEPYDENCRGNYQVEWDQ